MWKANETLKRFKECWDSVHATNHSEASRMLIGQDKLMGVDGGKQLAGDNKQLCCLSVDPFLGILIKSGCFNRVGVNIP